LCSDSECSYPDKESFNPSREANVPSEEGNSAGREIHHPSNGPRRTGEE
jgi:hypothetical protein